MDRHPCACSRPLPEMHYRQVGRGHETYDNVGIDLAYLAERGRITRVRRG
jgi:hypothetical protein